jgi:hypothetical protein
VRDAGRRNYVTGFGDLVGRLRQLAECIFVRLSRPYSREQQLPIAA